MWDQQEESESSNEFEDFFQVRREEYARKLREGTRSFTELSLAPKPEILVEGLMDKGALALVYAPSGSYKSFFGIDLACRLSRATNWFGHDIPLTEDQFGNLSPYNVLYVASEGGEFGLAKRVSAWANVNNKQPAVKFWPKRLPLTDSEWFEGFKEYLKQKEIDVFILDTFARCFPGLDENSNTSVNEAFDMVEELQEAVFPRRSAIIIHHTSLKQEDSNLPRGATVFVDRPDVILRLEKLQAKTPKVRLHFVKQRDDATKQPLSFDLGQIKVTSALGEDWGNTLYIQGISQKNTDKPPVSVF